MSKFPMIEKLGLMLRQSPNFYVVKADELEALLQSAKVVYREKTSTLESSWIEESRLSTHINPTEKPFSSE